MGKKTFFNKIKQYVSSIGWKLFIWGLDISEEDYWERIYQQEKYYKIKNNLEL